MENLDVEADPLAGQETNTGYSLPLPASPATTCTSEELVSLPVDGELTDDTAKELPRLIIQEQLEETAVAHDGAIPGSDFEDGEKKAISSSCSFSQDIADTDAIEKDISNGALQQNSHPVQHLFSASEKSSEMTPMFVLTYNASKGTANIFIGQTDVSSKPDDARDTISSLENSEVVLEAAEIKEEKMELERDTNQSGQFLYLCGVEQCKVNSSSLEEIQKHQLVSHSERETYRVSENTCGPTSELAEQAYLCPYPECGRRFVWPAHLKYHILTHTGKRMFRCEAEGCNASFYTIQRLKVHRLTHTGEKPFVCHVENCKKAFTTQGNLANHIRTHSGEKPFLCACGKRFAEQSSLRKHKVTHTGKKPYECDICGKRFSQSGSRNVHMNRHKKLALLEQQTENKIASKNDHDIVLTERKPSKVFVLQTREDGPLQYQNSPCHESVVFSNAVTDHVVTVTTQPAEVELDIMGKGSAGKIGVSKPESELSSHLPSNHPGANVVVLSQPEEMVAMAPGYHHSAGVETEELVYTGHHLLHGVDMT